MGNFSSNPLKEMICIKNGIVLYSNYRKKINNYQK